MDTAAGEQAVRIVTKTYGEEKIIFINADTSNHSQMFGNYFKVFN